MSVFDDEEDDDFNVEEFERLSRIVQRNMSFSGVCLSFFPFVHYC